MTNYVPPSHQNNLANILVLLNEQKAHDIEQADQILALQAQISQLARHRAHLLHGDSHGLAAPSLQPHQSPQVNRVPVTAPHVLSRAAASLAADLQSGLGQTHNYGYSGLTIDSLRSNLELVSQANRLLAAATSNVPPLNPVLGMEGDAGSLQRSQVIKIVIRI